MTVLGIETSCDETAAAVVQDGNILLSNVVFSSMDLHTMYGGVVPEIAARSHIESIIPVIDEALQVAFPDANPQMPTPVFDPWSKIDAIAVTYGAGLGGSLLVGVMTARTLAITKNKPLYAVNHVEGHVYSNFITEIGANSKSEIRNPKQIRNSKLETQNWKLGDQTYHLPTTSPQFPILALIVSGGHTQLVLFRDHFDYTLLGQTRDDAIGEAFDKVAKITGLPYPGGPSIANTALKGNPKAFVLPKAKMSNKYDFSFSGLKTAVLRHAQEAVGEDFTFPSKDLPDVLSEPQKADIAAVFQRVAIETVVDKTIQAFEEFSPASVVVAGGVAANKELRKQLSERLPIEIQYTDPRLCTDNSAMIAALGCFKMKHNQPTADPYSLQIEPNLSM